VSGNKIHSCSNWWKRCEKFFIIIYFMLLIVILVMGWGYLVPIHDNLILMILVVLSYVDGRSVIS
jgi:hypothetical protein